MHPAQQHDLMEHYQSQQRQIALLRSENARLREELAELLAWKEGKRGVEEYLELREKYREAKGRLDRIDRLTEVSTTKAFLELPDTDKARWFATVAGRDLRLMREIEELQKQVKRLQRARLETAAEMLGGRR